MDHAWINLTQAQSHNHETGPMTNVAHYVGLDVHKDSISIAVAREGRDPAEQLARIPNDPTRLLKKLDRLGRRTNLLPATKQVRPATASCGSLTFLRFGAQLLRGENASGVDHVRTQETEVHR